MIKKLYWLHRWGSLLVLLQVCIWLLTGLYFSLVPHHEMQGRKYWQAPPSVQITAAANSLCSPQPQAMQVAASSIRLRQIAGKAQYVLDTPAGYHYLDAVTCQPWQTPAELAQQLALATYKGTGSMVALTGVENSAEQRDWSGPGFRIDMADDEHTRIYVDSQSGNVLPHRNNTWVISDWMLRLHFMDYSGKQQFNHWLIWLVATLALIFSFSGSILLWKRLSLKRL